MFLTGRPLARLHFVRDTVSHDTRQLERELRVTRAPFLVLRDAQKPPSRTAPWSRLNSAHRYRSGGCPYPDNDVTTIRDNP